MTTAQQLGVSREPCVTVNSSGGVTCNMIPQQSVSPAAAADMIDEEDRLFLFTLKHSIAMIIFSNVPT